MSQKIFVLDTNVLVYDPDVIFNFKENENIVIPSTVIEELDILKTEISERGRNSREIIRILDALRFQGSLSDGVKLKTGSLLKVLYRKLEFNIKLPFDVNSIDNRILLDILSLRNEGFEIEFISKDLNLRIKADILGIKALDYIKKGQSKDSIYKGWLKFEVSPVELKKDKPSILYDLEQNGDLYLNQFILLESYYNSYNNVLFRYLGNKTFKKVLTPDISWKLEPKNIQQLMALDLLFDDNIQLITLIGPAGTGKTFIALLAALHKVLVEHRYEKILVTRPVIPLGSDIGFLPGDIQEKLHSWMQPIYDNMEFITYSAKKAINYNEYDVDYIRKRKNKYDKDSKKNKQLSVVIPTLDELIRYKKLNLEAITYMRGRSIPFQYILIDESQNLTQHEVKTIISRVGQGSKIILCGDPYQIDHPSLTEFNNGLVVASSRFKGQSLFGSVYLTISERSELSRLANELL